MSESREVWAIAQLKLAKSPSLNYHLSSLQVLVPAQDLYLPTESRSSAQGVF